MREKLKRPINISVALVFGLAVVFLALRKFSYSAGILVGAGWLMANFLLTISLLEIAILKRSAPRVLLLLLVKFPVLYLLGFLVVSLKLFPVLSLFLGMSLIILVLGVSGICLLKSVKLNTNCQI